MTTNKSASPMGVESIFQKASWPARPPILGSYATRVPHTARIGNVESVLCGDREIKMGSLSSVNGMRKK